MKNLIFITILTFLCIGCADTIDYKKIQFEQGYYYDFYKEEELIRRLIYSKDDVLSTKIYFEGGLIKRSEEYIEGQLVTEYQRKKDSLFDCKIYFDDRIIYGKGNIDTLSREIGWWHYFNDKKQLLRKQQFYVVNNSHIINQRINYKNGKIDSLHSDLHKLAILEKIKDKVFLLNLFYERKLNEDSYVSILISNELNESFDNINFVKFDTISFMNKKEMNFPVIFKAKGKNNIRGIIFEQYKIGNVLNSDSLKLIERKTYLNEEIIIE